MASRFDYIEDLIRTAGESDRTLADIFLAIFRDLDARISISEDLAAGAQAIEKELIDYGTQKVDTAVTPIINELKASADLGAILMAGSVSLVEIGTGVRTFIINEAERLMFAPAASLAAVSNDDANLVLWGRRVAYDKETGELVVEVLSAEGSGSASSWTITVGTMADTASTVMAEPIGDFEPGSVQSILYQLMAAAMGSPSFGTSVTEALSNTLRLDFAQTLTSAQRLKALANMPTWGDAVEEKTADFSVTSADNFKTFLVSASAAARMVSLPLPSSVGAGFLVGFEKSDTGLNRITIGTLGFTAYLVKPGHAIYLYSDGANWHVLSERQNSGRTGMTVFNLSANTTLNALHNDAVINVDASAAARTITLPNASTAGVGTTLLIRKSDASVNTVTISGTVDSVSSPVLRLQWQSMLLKSNGAGWYLAGEAGDLPPRTKFSAKTSNYTVLLADDRGTITMDASSAARSFTLPAATAVPVGYSITLRKGDATFNAVTVVGTIEGATNYVLRLPRQSVTIVSDGTSWTVVEEAGTTYIATNANGRVVRFANGFQICTLKATIDFTGEFTATNRLSYQWTYPAAFAQVESAHLTLPMHASAQFSGVSGTDAGRMSVRAYGGGTTSTTAQGFSIFFEAGTINTSTATITGCYFSAEGTWY